MSPSQPDYLSLTLARAQRRLETRNLAPTTLREYKREGRSLQAGLGDLDLTATGPDFVTTYLEESRFDSTRGRRRAKATVRRRRSYVRSVYQSAVDDDMMANSPAASIPMPPMGEPFLDLPSPLSAVVDEERAAYALASADREPTSMEERDHIAFVFFAEIGLAFEAQAGLEVRDIGSHACWVAIRVGERVDDERQPVWIVPTWLDEEIAAFAAKRRTESGPTAPLLARTDRAGRLIDPETGLTGHGVREAVRRRLHATDAFKNLRTSELAAARIVERLRQGFDPGALARQAMTGRMRTITDYWRPLRAEHELGSAPWWPSSPIGIVPGDAPVSHGVWRRGYWIAGAEQRPVGGSQRLRARVALALGSLTAGDSINCSCGIRLLPGQTVCYPCLDSWRSVDKRWLEYSVARPLAEVEMDALERNDWWPSLSEAVRRRFLDQARMRLESKVRSSVG